MKHLLLQSLIIATTVCLFTGCKPAGDEPGSWFEDLEEPRYRVLFDQDWKFYRGDQPGAENPGFEDGSWRILDLPHDWSIEDIPGTGSPIDSTAIGGISTGYYVGGTGWYRKTFVIPEKLNGKRFTLQFDGIYMDADVWINGMHLGNHPYGYTSFWYDVTDKLVPGDTNNVAVRVRNEGRSSRWYPGSGIYRHVWLTITEPVHFANWGTFITTPVIEKERSSVLYSNEITVTGGYNGKIMITTEIRNGSGGTVTFREDPLEVTASGNVNLKQELNIPSPPVVHK